MVNVVDESGEQIQSEQRTERYESYQEASYTDGVHVQMDERTARYEAYQEADFSITTPPNTRLDQLSARVVNPHGNDVPCSIARGRDSKNYHVR